MLVLKDFGTIQNSFFSPNSADCHGSVIIAYSLSFTPSVIATAVRIVGDKDLFAK